MTSAPARRRAAGTTSTEATSVDAVAVRRATRKSAAPVATPAAKKATGTSRQAATRPDPASDKQSAPEKQSAPDAQSAPAKRSARTATGRTDGSSTPTGGRSPRQRVRAGTLDRILTIAHDRLVSGGADALSLRSVARELGMVSSAVYRYVASREDLLRLLAERAGTDLAGAVDTAAKSRRGDAGKRLASIAKAVRAWGQEHPGDFGLLFGRVGTTAAGVGATADRPEPGTGALGLPAALLRLYVEDGADMGAKLSPAARRELGVLGNALGVEAGPEAVARALSAWSAIAGAVAVEVSGQLSGVSGNPGALFDVQMDRIAAATGLGG